MKSALCVIGVLASMAAGSVVCAQDDQAAEAKPATATVERGEITLFVRQPGRIDSADRREVRIDLDAYSGGLEVAEVVHDGGAVEAGAVLLRLDTEDIDRQIEDATIALERAKQALEFAGNERDILAESSQVRMERAESAKRSAEHAFEVFDKYEGNQMLRQSELRVRQSEYSLEDQREELEQLKSMYEDSSLASETKEIVIKRNERQIAMSEEYLQFAREDLTIMRDYTYPDRKLDIENQLRWATIELEHARMQTAMAAARKEHEMQQATRALADAEDKLEELKRDREQFEIAAPAAGVLTEIDLDAGDEVRGGQAIAEIVDPSKLIVEFNASPADLRVLREGEAVSVEMPGFGELDVRGRITSIAPLGVAQGSATAIPVTVELSDPDDFIFAGLDCIITAERSRADVLRVPAKAVHEKDGRSFVKVLEDGEPVERAVRVGARGRDFIEIVSGVEAGDEVVVE